MVEVETREGSRYILYCIRTTGLCRVENIVLLFMVANGGFWLLAAWAKNRTGRDGREGRAILLNIA